MTVRALVGTICEDHPDPIVPRLSRGGKGLDNDGEREIHIWRLPARLYPREGVTIVPLYKSRRRGRGAGQKGSRGMGSSADTWTAKKAQKAPMSYNIYYRT